PPAGDDETLGGERFKADIVGAGGDGALDLRRQQALESLEQDILQLDRQRQQAIEERGDRRQIVPEPVRVGELEAGGTLKFRQRAALDLPGEDQQVEAAKG